MKCSNCSEEVDQLVMVQVKNKKRKVCEDCAEELRQENEVGEEAESAMQQMMEYKGR